MSIQGEYATEDAVKLGLVPIPDKEIKATEGLQTETLLNIRQTRICRKFIHRCHSFQYGMITR